MSHKKQYNRDPFETAGWSMKAYKTPKKVLEDIFSNDNPAYFKSCINLMICSHWQIKPLNRKKMETIFRIFGRVNSLILVAHYYYKKRQRRKDSGSILKSHKFFFNIFTIQPVTHWKSEWYYSVQNVYVRRSIDDRNTIYTIGYFITTIIDIMYSQYCEDTNR